MKRLLLLLSVLFLTNSILTHSADSADNKERFRMGLSYASFGNINHNDAQAALKAWADSFVKERALPLTVNVRLYERELEIVEAFLEENLDAMTLTTEEFMQLEVEPESIFLNVRGNDLYERYVIIVHRNSGISGPADLKGQKLIRHNSQRMVLALPWLEVLLADHSGGPIIKWLSDLTETDNPSKGIFQVFFRQTDAAVVTKDAFEIACELNPQLQKDLMILEESPPFITSLMFIRPGYQGNSREKIESGILDLHNTTAGRQVMVVFQSLRMEKHPVSILDNTTQFLSRYHRLGYQSHLTGLQK